MKDQETDYLNKLFAGAPDEADESAVDFPLLEVPAGLTANLYAISEQTPGRSHSKTSRGPQNWTNKSWPKFTSIAASLLIAVVLILVYQQHQTLKQLEQAQSDLATALHYLGEANKITRAQMRRSLNANMQKAAVAPVIELGRDALSETIESLDSSTKRPNRKL